MAKKYPAYLKKSNLRLIGRWVQPVLGGSFWPWWPRTRSFDKYGFEGIDGRMAFLDHNHFDIAKDVAIMENRAIEALETENLAFFRKAYLDSIKTINWFEKKGIKAMHQFGKGDVQGSMETFVPAMREIIAPWSVAIFLSYGTERFMERLAEREGLDPHSVASFVRVPRPTPLMEYEIKTRKIANELEDAGFTERAMMKSPRDALKMLRKASPTIYDELISHVKKYEWIGTHHFWGEPLTPEKLIDHVQELEGEAQPGRKDPPPHLAHVFKIAGELAYIRQLSAEISDIIIYGLWPMYRAAAAILGRPGSQIWLTGSEYLEGFEGIVMPSKAALDERKKTYGIFENEGKDVVIIGSELQKLLPILLPKVNTSIREWKGTIACKGKARGKVRIIELPEDVAELKLGEILVTNQTTPDFVPAMRRAGAIVTDEGGLTCHAAIVSRELGKPCIVGTKISTKLLKTGDLIEVDAEKGTVRKLQARD